MDMAWPEITAHPFYDACESTTSGCSTPMSPCHPIPSRRLSAASPTASVPTPPDNITLGLWPHATSEQIKHYVAGYEALFPSAEISLLHHSKSTDEVASVLDALTQIREKPDLDERPAVLLHCFGNDAAAHACRLLRAYNARTGQTLGVRAVVMDAVPSLRAPALEQVLKSPWDLLKFIFTSLWILTAWLLMYITFTDQAAASARLRQDLHDPLLIPAGARRCYTDTAKDLMFSWDNPGADAGSEDECRGHAVKRSSVDKKGHWNGDQERYWAAIEELWEGR